MNKESSCSAGLTTVTVLGFLPYWFRFAQCLRKVYDDPKKNRIQLVNAGKYFSDLCVPLSNIWLVDSHLKGGHLKYDRNASFWNYCSVHFIATTYSYIWDIRMDWGLMTCFEKGKWGLRKQLNYPPWFYYFAAVMDFFLRYLWILGLFSFGKAGTTFVNFQTMSLIFIFAEAFRRALWALLRVENEQNNNLEAYRTIPYIPPIVEDDDDVK